MAKRARMDDVIILLPGIMGSVLERHGETVWSMPKILGPALLGNSKAFEPLALKRDDPEAESLGDGVRPVRLMTGIHGIHGLALSEGYQRIQDEIVRRFNVVVGTPESTAPANFIPFPYDWRRDNRASARRLKRVAEQALGRWREHRGSEKPRLILIGHSMGGLVARYYLEALGGWEHARALITIATPHRGSPNAIGSLTTSHKLGRAELLHVVQSFTSVYQLLPRYQSVLVGGVPQYPHTLAAELKLPKAQLDQAWAFHQEIERGAEQERDPRRFLVEPIVGTFQPTLQSALLEAGKVAMSWNLPEAPPDELNTPWLNLGDGTVPYISQIPIEQSEDFRSTYVPGKHAHLPNDTGVLDSISHMLTRMQAADYMRRYRGGVTAPEAARRPALSLEIESAVAGGDALRPRARIVQRAEDPGSVLLTITPEGGAPLPPIELAESGAETWSAEVPALAPGLYTARVETYSQGPLAPRPVQDVFEVYAQ